MRRQRGFTLLEVLIVLAITSLIIAPLTLATTTLMTGPQRTTDQSIVLQQVQNTGYWLSRDVQMARSVNSTDPNGFPLTINIPVDTDENNDYTIDYLFNGNTLKRQVYDSSHILVSETFIANYIDTNNTTFSEVEPAVYQLTVRAVIDETSETITYEIKQRLSLSPG
ncbi:type II secretion system protein J [Chloroflexota bacterium]